MNNILSQSDISSLVSMSSIEINNSSAQMTALLSEMISEKGRIDQLTTMLEKQPWYKKCLYTVLGKNKATIKEISEHKDMIAAYTSEALACLYKNNRIEQIQIVAIGEAINSVNAQLTATNYELLKTQENICEIRKELIKSIYNLATVLNEKIISVDNFHLLIKEIENGTYDKGNSIATLFIIISQIDRRTVEDGRKLELLRTTLEKQGYLSDSEQTLGEYMTLVSKIPDDLAGSIYYEFFCLTGNQYAEMFAELMERYVFLPKMEKKSKKTEMIIKEICEKNHEDAETLFSTKEIYDYFIEGKKDYLFSIGENNEQDERLGSESDNCDVEIEQREEKYSEDNLIVLGAPGTRKKGLKKLITYLVNQGYDIPKYVPIWIYTHDERDYKEYSEFLLPYKETIEANGIIVVLDFKEDQFDGLYYKCEQALEDISYWGSPIYILGDIQKALALQDKNDLDTWSDEATFIRHIIDASNGDYDGDSDVTDNKIFEKHLDEFKLEIDQLGEDIKKNKEIGLKNAIDNYLWKVPKDSSCKSYTYEDLKSNYQIFTKLRDKVGKKSTGEMIGCLDWSFLGTDGILFTSDGIAFEYVIEKIFIRYDEITNMYFDKKGTHLLFEGYFNSIKDPDSMPAIADIYVNLRELGDLLLELKSIISYYG